MTQTSRLTDVPKNLAEVMEGSQEGYALVPGYYLELVHGLWGFFPAVLRGTKRVVVTTDAQLLQDVWKTLTPRRSKMVTTTLFASAKLGIGYPILGSTPQEREESEPLEILTREEFEEIIAANPFLFEWTPGLVGNDMSPEEFARTIENARQ